MAIPQTVFLSAQTYGAVVAFASSSLLFLVISFAVAVIRYSRRSTLDLEKATGNTTDHHPRSRPSSRLTIQHLKSAEKIGVTIHPLPIAHINSDLARFCRIPQTNQDPNRPIVKSTPLSGNIIKTNSPTFGSTQLPVLKSKPQSQPGVWWKPDTTTETPVTSPSPPSCEPSLPAPPARASLAINYTVPQTTSSPKHTGLKPSPKTTAVWWLPATEAINSPPVIKESPSSRLPITKPKEKVEPTVWWSSAAKELISSSEPMGEDACSESGSSGPPSPRISLSSLECEWISPEPFLATNVTNYSEPTLAWKASFRPRVDGDHIHPPKNCRGFYSFDQHPNDQLPQGGLPRLNIDGSFSIGMAI